jgi:hypothetical protein
MKNLRTLLFLLVPSAALLAIDPPKGERVFVTAHSFHIFIAPRLAPLAKAAGIEGHLLAGSQMIGGSKVIQHWNLPDDKNKAKAALVSSPFIG